MICLILIKYYRSA